MDISKWEYQFTFGEGLDIYRKGEHRVAIDRKTGNPTLFYNDSKKLRTEKVGNELSRQGNRGSKETKAED